MSSAPATLAGQLVLPGELVGLRRGSVTLEAWEPGEFGHEDARPYLSRTYELADPDWTALGSGWTRYFGLCDADRVGDPARPLPAELEIEARFEPEGRDGTSLGLARGSARARNGAKDIEISVSPSTETAQPPATRKKGG